MDEDLKESDLVYVFTYTADMTQCNLTISSKTPMISIEFVACFIDFVNQFQDDPNEMFHDRYKINKQEDYSQCKLK